MKTTIPDQSGRRLPDLIERDFSIGEPNRRYVGDITYLPIADGTNLYLATCIDLGSRKLGGLAGRRPHAHRTRRGRPASCGP